VERSPGEGMIIFCLSPLGLLNTRLLTLVFMSNRTADETTLLQEGMVQNRVTLLLWASRVTH
jgi:hypothetical protein